MSQIVVDQTARANIEMGRHPQPCDSEGTTSLVSGPRRSGVPATFASLLCTSPGCQTARQQEAYQTEIQCMVML